MGGLKTQDIVIPCRPGDYNPSLMYCLRSIEQNFPHRKVWVAGHCPYWLTDEVGKIPVDQPGSGWQNVMAIMSTVSQHPEVSENFWYFNDDFYVVKKAVRPTALTDMTLAERVFKLEGMAMGDYVSGARKTLELLDAAGFEGTPNFDLHLPMPMTKAGIDDAIGFVMRSGEYFWPHLRTIYGALTGLKGKPIAGDVKIGFMADGIPDNALYVSSDPRTISNGQLGRELKLLFPAPSRFEFSAEPH